MSHFDERSGVILCCTHWGHWWQTIDEVWIKVTISRETRAKEIQCDIATNSLKVSVKGRTIIEGSLPHSIHASDSIWTLEDDVSSGKCLQICLPKANRGICWRSLLDGEYAADPLTFNQMEQKLTLQRFQFEQPGMDFSGATISGNFQNGGPTLPS